MTDVILDPLGIAVDRVELNLNSGALRVNHEGIDWGDAQVNAYMSEMARGESPVDFRIPNRQIVIPLTPRTEGASDFASAKAQLQQKVGQLQREGGWLQRGDGLYADIVNAILKFPDRWGYKEFEEDVVLTLEALPDFYGEEEELAEVTASEEGDVLAALIEGDYPARCRIVVSEGSDEDQLGLLWGIRSRHYVTDTTARLAYEAEALTPLDSAAIGTLSGASGGGSGNNVRHTNLGTDWTPVLSTEHDAEGHLTHTGTYRVWARVYSASGTAVKLRFLWDVGDLTLPVENTPWIFPAADQFYLADLGEIRLDQVPVGGHRWQGIVQAKGDDGGESVRIDTLLLQPLDESAGRLSALTERVEGAGASAPRSPATGADDSGTGTISWSNPGNVVTTNDSRATVSLNNQVSHYLKATNFGFAIPVGATISGIKVAVERSASGANQIKDSAVQIVKGGVIQATNRAVSTAWPTTDIYKGYGSATDLWGTSWTVSDINSANFGVAISAQTVPPGAAATARIDHIRITVYYTTADGSAPGADAVVYAAQSAELRTDGMFREDSAGAAYGPVSHVIGDLPRLPPSGLEERPVELLLKGSRGDLGQLPDDGIDALGFQVFYRPSFLLPPA